jgi:hypothetical protein
MPLSTPRYGLRYPIDNEVADVPQDIKNLADDIVRSLDTKIDTNAVVTGYQTKILVTNQLPATANEGDIVFLVP